MASAVKGDVLRIRELSIANAMATETTTECEVRIKDLDSTIATISYVDLVGVRVYGDATRVLELQRSPTFSADAVQ